MAIKLADKPNSSAPNSSYPYGNIKDNTGVSNGTPLNQLVHADFHQFFAKLLDIGETIGYITANGLPENDDNGFQYVDALYTASRLANKNLLGYLAQTLIGTILPSVPYALIGLAAGVSPAIAPGYIYYDGRLFVCAGWNPAIVNTAQFNQTNEAVLTITDSVTPGLFNYGDLLFVPNFTAALALINTPEAWIAPTLAASWANVTTVNPAGYYKTVQRVQLKGLVKYTSGSSGSDVPIFTLPTGYRPAWPMKFSVPMVLSGGSITSFSNNYFMTVEVTTAGVVQFKEYFGAPFTDVTVDLSGISFRIA